MSSPGLYLLGFLGAAVVVVVGMLAAAHVLRVEARTRSRLKARPYECGEEPEGKVWIQFHPRYLLVALLFLLFDVEAIFLFPYALGSRGLGWAGIAAIGLFVGVLLLGWAYAVRKDAIKWQ
jgi:NADH-quinone oxidoreductase subunit A